MAKIKRIQILHILLASSALLVFLCTTNPKSVAVWLLFVPVIMLGGIMYFATLLFLKSGFVSPARPRLIAVVVALLPCIILLLKSIGQLTAKDSLLMILFVALAGFYVSVLRFGKVPE